jgi:hypothetical protein
VILILEDDGDREAYQQGPLVFLDHMRQGCCTVWISPGAYAEDVVLADLRKRAEDIPTVEVDGVKYLGMVRYVDVLVLLGESA